MPMDLLSPESFCLDLVLFEFFPADRTCHGFPGLLAGFHQQHETFMMENMGGEAWKFGQLIIILEIKQTYCALRVLCKVTGEHLHHRVSQTPIRYLPIRQP